MDTTLMNSKISETYNPHRQLFHLTDIINLTRSDNYVALSNLSVYYTGKKIKKVIQKQ